MSVCLWKWISLKLPGKPDENSSESKTSQTILHVRWTLRFGVILDLSRKKKNKLGEALYCLIQSRKMQPLIISSQRTTGTEVPDEHTSIIFTVWKNGWMESLLTFTRELIFPSVKMMNISRQTTHCFYFSDSGISLSRIFVKSGQLGCGEVGSSGRMRAGRLTN